MRGRVPARGPPLLGQKMAFKFCEILNVRESLRFRDPQPRRKPLLKRPDPELEAWAAARAFELTAAGYSARVIRPRGQAPVVVYRVGHS